MAKPIHRRISYAAQADILALHRRGVSVQVIAQIWKLHELAVKQLIAHGLPDTSPVRKHYRNDPIVHRAPCGHLITTEFCISCEVERISLLD